MSIKNELITWYIENKRDLPWRNTTNPYTIWVSEVILQQTRVKQGITYFEDFINAFPDIKSLAEAPIDSVLKQWQGLGYYSRARNLHESARQIVYKRNGKFPDTYQELLKLKGVGPYTAAAIASFAFKLPHAVVDGNVTRVLSRVFDIDLAVNSTEGVKEIQKIATASLDKKQPDVYNQAIMELGAIVCTPTNPDCENCPLRYKCLARKNKTIAKRPVKIKAKPPKPRYIDYVILESGSHLVFKKRTRNDIWKGLHDFVAIEGKKEPTAIEITREILEKFPDIRLLSTPGNYHKKYTHILSHQRITARFWHFKINGKIKNNSVYFSVLKEEVGQLAVSRLIHKYLEDLNYV